VEGLFWVTTDLDVSPIDAVGPKPASKTSMKRAKKEETKRQAVNVWGGNSDVSCQPSNKS